MDEESQGATYRSRRTFKVLQVTFVGIVILLLGCVVLQIRSSPVSVVDILDSVGQETEWTVAYVAPGLPEPTVRTLYDMPPGPNRRCGNHDGWPVPDRIEFVQQSEGIVFVTSYCNPRQFAAIDVESGEILWSQTHDLYGFSGVLAAEGFAVITAEQTMALDLHTGEVLWNTASGGRLRPRLIVDGVLIKAGYDDKIRYGIAALDVITGELVWEKRLQSDGPGLLVRDNRLYMLDRETLSEVSIHSGEYVRQMQIPTDGSSLSMDSNSTSLIFHDSGGWIAAYDFETWDHLWTVDIWDKPTDPIRINSFNWGLVQANDKYVFAEGRDSDDAISVQIGAETGEILLTEDKFTDMRWVDEKFIYRSVTTNTSTEMWAEEIESGEIAWRLVLNVYPYGGGMAFVPGGFVYTESVNAWVISIPQSP